jgi:hypothetical protein
MQKKFDDSMVQLLQVVTSSKTITERMSGDVRGIRKTVYRIEFHHVVQFFAPTILPDAVLLKVRSLARRVSTPNLHNPKDLKVPTMIRDWALAESLSLLIVRVGLRAQKQAKELAMNVVESLKSTTSAYSGTFHCPTRRRTETSWQTSSKASSSKYYNTLAGCSVTFPNN